MTENFKVKFSLLLYVYIYTKLQNFIHLSVTMTKLCHIKGDHTHTRLTALFPGLPKWAGTRKAKAIWILLKQETMSGNGISWNICKSAPRSRQITMPAPHVKISYHNIRNYCRGVAGCGVVTRIRELLKGVDYYFCQVHYLIWFFVALILFDLFSITEFGSMTSIVPLK